MISLISRNIHQHNYRFMNLFQICVCRINHSNSSNTIITQHESQSTHAYEKVHEEACNKNLMTYVDPLTSYTVITKIAHLKRGFCCGNKCRHCPYNHINVGVKNTRKEK